MAKQLSPVELSGYLDGELDDERIEFVESYLAEDQLAAEQIAQYGLQGDLIRRLYNPLINRPLPPQMAGRLQFMNGKSAKGRSSGQNIFLFLILFLIAATLGAAFLGLLPPSLENWATSLLNPS